MPVAMGASQCAVLCVCLASMGALATAFQPPLHSFTPAAVSSAPRFCSLAPGFSAQTPKLATTNKAFPRRSAGPGALAMQSGTVVAVFPHAFELTGMVKLINDMMTFDSGFTKREFVVTTNEMYPQDVKFEVVKDRCALLDSFAAGEQVKVSFNIRGNQWQGKYFVNLQAWRIEKLASGGLAAQVEASMDLADWDDFGSKVDDAKPSNGAAKPRAGNETRVLAAGGQAAPAGGSKPANIGWDEDIPF